MPSTLKRKKRKQGGETRVKCERIEENVKLEKVSDDEKFEEELRRGPFSAAVVVKAEPVSDSKVPDAKVDDISK